MSDKKPPPIGTEEFKEWLRQQTKADIKDIFSNGPADFDAELFPDELEEYTPEERRKLFKVYSSNLDGSDEK